MKEFKGEIISGEEKKQSGKMCGNDREIERVSERGREGGWMTEC